MICLLFIVFLGIMALFPLFETLPGDLVMVVLDSTKHRSFVVMVRVLKAILLAAVVSATFVITKLHRRSVYAGSVDLTDQVLQANMTVVAFLTGFMLISILLFESLHPTVRECSSLRNSIKAEERKLAQKKDHESQRLNILKVNMASLKTTVRKLESKVEAKKDHVKAVEENVMALRRRFEELKLKYDESLEYNQNLRNQLELYDQNTLLDDEERGWRGFNSAVIDYGDIQIPWAVSTSKKGSAESTVIEMETADPSCEYSCSGFRVLSSPRHRRPIFLHL